MGGSVPNAKRKVFVVDDHPVFREGLVGIIAQQKDLTVCGEAADAAETLKAIRASAAELAVIDISLDGMNGIDLIKSLRSSYPKLRLLVVSMHAEMLHAERALRAGANGYVMKKEKGAQLLEAIRTTLDGKVFLSAAMNEQILQRVTGGVDIGKRPMTHGLSDREYQVFQFIGQGYGTRQIAEALNVSMKTVETHREHIREKLKLGNTFELVQRAIHWMHHERESA